jgi:hypothetical protein
MERKQYKFWKIIRIDRRQNSFFFKGDLKVSRKREGASFFIQQKKLTGQIG